MKLKRIGFGQVEPNHLSAQGNRQIYAQLPCASDIEVLENGQFAKYDYANGEVNFDADSDLEYLLVLNEVKVYDERDTYKDFAMIKENYLNGEMYPRLFRTQVGDIYTTNCIGVANNDKRATVTYNEEIGVGTDLTVNANGYLEIADSDAEGMIWRVVKVYTMPDGQDGVKIQRIK